MRGLTQTLPVAYAVAAGRAWISLLRTAMPSGETLPSSTLVGALRRAMLRWYDRHRRDLPWRSDQPDPYHVLVSEAMLQQTQVATVIAYFNRFIERFPGVHELAAADEQEVLHAWQGLGYYRRARHLHAAAGMIVSEHEGAVPRAVDALLALPGVGRYTAGAIASIAFGERAPIVDGNVARVLARWFAIETPVNDSATQRRLWALAERLVPPGRAGDFNQSLMELGATVCTPKSPECLTCPVARYCDAKKLGRVETFPVKKAPAKARDVAHHVLAIERRGRYLFQRRPAAGLWSNMWQLPTAEAIEGDKEVARSLCEWGQRSLGLKITRVERVDQFIHQTTHRRITFTLWRACSVSGRVRTGGGMWRKLNEIDDLPLANPQRRAAGTLMKLVK